MSWVSVRVGVWTLAFHVLSCCVSVRSRVRLAVHSPVHGSCGARSSFFYRLRAFMLCLVLCGTQLVYFIWCVLSCCRVNTQRISILYSYVFVSCFAHGWWFVCWPCASGFVLCEHIAFVLVVLTPPILLPDYWLIFPTCLPSLPSSFVPFIISLCLQSCASTSLMLLWWYPTLPCPALPCPALPCPILSRQTLLPAVLFFPYGVVSICLFYYQNRAHPPAQLSPRLIPSSPSLI